MVSWRSHRCGLAFACELVLLHLSLGGPETGLRAHGRWDRKTLVWNPDFGSWVGTRWTEMFSFNKQRRKQRPELSSPWCTNAAGEQQNHEGPDFPSYR